MSEVEHKPRYRIEYITFEQILILAEITVN